jgi:hypothetical protein
MCITTLQTLQDILTTTLLCESGTVAHIIMHAYPCTRSPLAIPDADLAIMLSPIQAIVLVPYSIPPRPLVIVMTNTNLCRASGSKVC